MSERLLREQEVIDALADYICNIDKVYCTGRLSAEDCKDAAHSVLDELPSAEPQIIYCKDCKYYHRNIACVGGKYSGCSLWLNEGNEIEVEENDFCSCAERRTDG